MKILFISIFFFRFFLARYLYLTLKITDDEINKFWQTRSQLLLVDVCNLLLCVSEILPSICENGESYVGLNLTGQSKIIRDVHAKCQELFCCLLLRGVPLGSLYKVNYIKKCLGCTYSTWKTISCDF